MTSRISRIENSSLKKLKDEIADETTKEIEAMVDVIEILESGGDREEAARRHHDSVVHSKKAVALLDEVESKENS